MPSGDREIAKWCYLFTLVATFSQYRYAEKCEQVKEMSSNLNIWNVDIPRLDS